MEQNILILMKTSYTLRNYSSRKDGVALVIVLSMIVLLSALLVAFMSSVGTESTSAKIAVKGVEARQLAESAVNLAISQIRDATRGDSGVAAKPGGWASQPGVIRRFNEDGSEGRVYKLYSALEMVAENGVYPPGINPANPDSGGNPKLVLEEAGIDPADWTKTPTAFVDLNEPVLVPEEGKSGYVFPRYPIVDPRASEGEPGKALDSTKRRVQGFTAKKIINTTSELKDGGYFAFPPEQGEKSTVRLLPMRARWIFQLRDGTLVPGVAVAGEDDKVTVKGATEQNPIIGRFAFWTDDETGKVCINTATENTFWDTPHASTVQESGRITTQNLILDANGYPLGSNGIPSLALGASQPARSEYQRFPGHPATTNLSPTLRWLFDDPKIKPVISDVQFKEAIYRLQPRIYGDQGSSVAGTQITEYRTDLRAYEHDRLFNSLDEYWFRPDRSPLSLTGLYPVFSSNTKDARQASERFNPEAFEMMRFFMTASNRAPDLNLWGLPRISIWPIHSNDDPDPKRSRRSGFDDLLAFCSTTGKTTGPASTKKTYYFTRNNPWSPTADISLPRNVQLLDYLTSLTDRKVPGAGTSFAAKYGTPATAAYNGAKTTERDQILTQIFDYIRSTNLVDTGRKDGTPAPPAGTANYPLAYTPGYGSLNGGTKPILGSGQVVPSQRIVGNVVGSMGFGRFVTVSEVALVFYHDTSPAILSGDLIPPPPPVPPAVSKPTEPVPSRCVLLLEMNSPAPGYPALSEGYAYKVIENIQVKSDITAANAQPVRLNLANGADFNMVETDSWRGPYGRFFMPTRGFGNQFWYDPVANNPGLPKAKIFWKTGAVLPQPADRYSYYPYFSQRMQLGTVGNPQFQLIGGEVTIEIYSLNIPVNPVGAAAPPPFHPQQGEKIQTITVKFPPATLPSPKAGTPFQQRITNVSGARDDRNIALGWISGNDTVRSMELNGTAAGDIRFAAARPVVQAELFSEAISKAAYTGSGNRLVHNLRLSWGQRYTGAQNGVLSAGASQRGDKVVDLPFVFNGVPLAGNTASITGDFDRGMSKHIDGAFINKPDEGNTRYNFAQSDMDGGGGIPYYRGGNGYEETGQTYFSPNRLISSPVMFGSLPTGQFSMKPWQTLLFRPGYAPHKGIQKPADHLLLDLFQMAVVEPYAISEPLSSTGKVNLNTRLAPYGYVPATGAGNPVTSPAYIERTTGLHAVLKGMYQMAVPNGTPESAHSETPLTGAANASILRWPIDPYKTISDGIIKKNYFKTASEICDIDLLMVGRALTGSPTAASSASNRQSFWEQHNMTGDNMRERPYSHIYPRLTTKSNTFTVHVRAQSVSKRSRKNWDVFDEADDLVTGEYRGSTTIERFIDPNDDLLSNFDAVTEIKKPTVSNMEAFYRFRITGSKQFIAR